ncbi:unnamed protein product [Macrosiphum euphorbiae]|uniref:Uncharacterized protein n=1 Tax=Macrosiphum euphorbiae TaxID=13131 RepID=A0AAV0X364_9HEMI|nr:unnamed protein product [Macrosiphum euphorbiae]
MTARRDRCDPRATASSISNLNSKVPPGRLCDVNRERLKLAGYHPGPLLQYIPMLSDYRDGTKGGSDGDNNMLLY